MSSKKWVYAIVIIIAVGALTVFLQPDLDEKINLPGKDKVSEETVDCSKRHTLKNDEYFGSGSKIRTSKTIFNKKLDTCLAYYISGGPGNEFAYYTAILMDMKNDDILYVYDETRKYEYFEGDEFTQCAAVYITYAKLGPERFLEHGCERYELKNKMGETLMQFGFANSDIP